MDFRDTVKMSTLPNGLRIVQAAFQQKPGTFYYGAITDNLPSGEEIQRRDFSGQNGRHIERSVFNPRPKI